MTSAVHKPVLLEEALEYLAPQRGGLMVDATMGEGGHSGAFLARFEGLRIIGVDADRDIQEVAKKRLEPFSGRVYFYSMWAQDFFAKYPAEFEKPRAILIDLGVSLYHYEKSGRGFSFQKDEKLDMRLDATDGVTAEEILGRLSQKELADLLYNNAQERYSRRIATVIADARQKGSIATTGALAALVEKAVPARRRRGPAHPATRTFMALRIAVNGELSRLQSLLEGALRVLEPGGRLGVISFHSLEDRVVKFFFKSKSKNCSCPPEAPICACGPAALKILTPKGIAAGSREIKENPPSRSARLRVAEKI